MVHYLDQKGLSNDINFLKFLDVVSSNVMEDSAVDGVVRSRDMTPEAAKMQIQELIQGKDPDFTTALNDNRHPGHEAALQQWRSLHLLAGG